MSMVVQSSLKLKSKFNIYIVQPTNFVFLYRFSLVKEHLIEFNQLAMANAEGSDDMLNRVMTKDNISLVALLQTKDSDSGMLFTTF